MSAVGMQCAVCGCWDGDGGDDETTANLVEMFTVVRGVVDPTERYVGEAEERMPLCEDCATLDPIVDEVDVFGTETRVYLA